MNNHYDDVLWFVNWAKNNNLSNRTINAISRGMNEKKITMFNLTCMKLDDFVVGWRGLGVKSLEEFMSVFEKLKRDWGQYYSEFYLGVNHEHCVD